MKETIENSKVINALVGILLAHMDTLQIVIRRALELQAKSVEAHGPIQFIQLSVPRV